MVNSFLRIPGSFQVGHLHEIGMKARLTLNASGSLAVSRNRQNAHG
jgi:hypothetical protein